MSLVMREGVNLVTLPFVYRSLEKSLREGIQSIGSPDKADHERSKQYWWIRRNGVQQTEEDLHVCSIEVRQSFQTCNGACVLSSRCCSYKCRKILWKSKSSALSIDAHPKTETIQKLIKKYILLPRNLIHIASAIENNCDCFLTFRRRLFKLMKVLTSSLFNNQIRCDASGSIEPHIPTINSDLCYKKRTEIYHIAWDGRIASFPCYDYTALPFIYVAWVDCWKAN